MSFYVVDVEADGPIPGDYSMTEFGAVLVRGDLSERFYGNCHPVSDKWDAKALAISGKSREEVLKFSNPLETMKEFRDWIKKTSKGRPIFISDNPCFDWQFINWYFHHFLGENPFGFSGRRIGDLYCGLQKNAYASWKHLRDTSHTHDPVMDALGNAEALLKIREMGLRISYE
jgi:DNA polymerase III epsilon subunit-like protein